MYREILDNALDELTGYKAGKKIDIEYDESQCIFMVEDDGRGIPLDKVTIALSQTLTGRNFSEDRNEVAGANGIGASGVNFCSEYFRVIIHRDGKKFYQEFTEGNAVDDSLQITSPKIREVKSEKTGTRIEFKISKTVLSNPKLPAQFVKDRLFEVALSNPDISITFNGEKIKVNDRPEKTLFKDDNIMTINIDRPEFKSFFMIKPNFCEGEFIHSTVNNIPAFIGGLHVDEFKRSFITGMINALEKESKKLSLKLNRNDVSEGLLWYNITKMKAPNFDSQSKTRLMNDEPVKIIKEELSKEILFKGIVKKNPEWIEEIFDRCAIRTNKKDLDDIAKAAKKISRKKIPKLMDANGIIRKNCILVVCEGDSAIGKLSCSRDPNVHGGLPLRGKVMNVNGEHSKKVIESQALVDIMVSLGLTIGEKATDNNMRYGKLYIATDSDEDGKSIETLVVNFLYTYWPELFDPKNSKIFSFQTPFIIASRGKERKYWYSDDYQNFDSEKYKGWSITRAKGLGSLEDPDWKHSLTNPRIIPITDDGNLKESLDLVFNKKRSDDRKVWMGISE
jgi:DNA gyrase/topoisomerase IV subunit B